MFTIILLAEYFAFAPYKVIGILESAKLLLVESGILGIGIQNPAFVIQNTAKEWIQNPFAENPLQIVLTAFMHIHATTVVLKSRPANRADYADCTDHVERALFAGEFRLLQLARN